MTHLLLALILSFSVSFDEARRVTLDDPILVATAQTAPAQCEATFDSVNNTSDHDTDLLIISGGQTFVIADVETGAHIVKTINVTLGDTVEMWLRPNTPNGRGKFVTSLGGTVTFECEQATTTTTTQPTTTTTEVPPSTTTTTPPSTSTSSTSTIPTTTTLPNDTTTTLPEQSSTTTTPETTSTTSPAPTTTAPTASSTTPDTLPRTGADATAAAGAGLLALLAGAGLVWVAREDN